jgi:hypothetical protein
MGYSYNIQKSQLTLISKPYYILPNKSFIILIKNIHAFVDVCELSIKRGSFKFLF